MWTFIYSYLLIGFGIGVGLNIANFGFNDVKEIISLMCYSTFLWGMFAILFVVELFYPDFLFEIENKIQKFFSSNE